MKPFALGSKVRLRDFLDVAEKGRKVVLRRVTRGRMARSRTALERAMASGATIYGVNTGFGELASRRISADGIRTLNTNYIRSHCSGVGKPLGEAEARGIVFLRANELARGYAACRPQVALRLAALLNRGVTPRIPSRGSVGASGDLAPMAHVALVLLGEGEATYRGRVVKGPRALAAAGIKALVPEAKESLSLTNGTQGMQSVGAVALNRARRVLDAADSAAAASLEAVRGTPVPYDAHISRLKPHHGQVKTAARLRRLLAGSEIRESHREDDDRVQDPYSFRCVPQVHGTVRDALESATAVLSTEMNSVTDNPLLAGDRFLSGGNFHGMAVSLAFDHAAIALTILGAITERRIFQVISGFAPDLPPFLAEQPGLESGFMIPQVAAAALASENKTLAHPASADSIPTSANKEDFVSMGMWSALKLGQVADNSARIVAIELLAAARGVEFHKPAAPGKGVARALKILRKRVPPLPGDRVATGPIEKAAALVLGGGFGDIL